MKTKPKPQPEPALQAKPEPKPEPVKKPEQKTAVQVAAEKPKQPVVVPKPQKKKLVKVGPYGRSFADPATKMEFVFVPGGCFEMGDVFGEGDFHERPPHRVCVNNFYIGKYEVTQ